MYSRWRGIGKSSAVRGLRQQISESDQQKTWKINLLSLKVVWHKGLLGPLHVLSVVGTTQEHVMMAPIPTSSVVRRSLDQENSPDVVTNMLKVFTFDVYALLDPGANLSFMTLYVAM
ncbi:hypothetical protein H5410_021902, partial [Solanum commersonii]